MEKGFSIYIERREKLIKTIREKHHNKNGVVLFLADFENKKYKFRQESTFYYFTGLEEPGMALSVSLNGPTFAYLAQYSEPRNKWATSILYGADKSSIKSWGIDEIQYLGNVCQGYSISSLCGATEYEYLLKILEDHAAQGNYIFTTYAVGGTMQKMIIDRFISLLPGLAKQIIDISDIVSSFRRTKSKDEIEHIYNAVDCTIAAQEGAAQIIDADEFEHAVEAGIEFVYIQSGGRAAFPSIVASGKNSTILHYNANNSLMKKGDLVIVDIGADIDYYCADITRTYPVSGIFSKRQKELYNIVLETQEYIESLAQPGYWLYNKAEPQKSLHHLSYEFLEKIGYAKYFTHKIGHFLGLDVHDLGDYNEPLKEGDIITIEPGIYIPEEGIGIRIEDNYWIVKDGVLCLSQDLPKDPHLIEELMAQSGFDEDEFED